MSRAGGLEIKDQYRYSLMCLKYSLKSIDGLGDDLELTFDEDGSLSEESLSELLQLSALNSLVGAATSLVNEIKEHEIDGVKIDLSKVKSLEPKKKTSSAQL